MEDFAAGQGWRLPELYQSDMLKKKNPAADVQSDKVFVTRLLKNAFAGYEGYFKMISESVKGWESDRLNSSDIALVALGLAEDESFPEIPLKVTMNEYVEISKCYSLPKSSSFVNGDAAQRKLMKLIQKLPQKQRVVFSLRYFDDMKYEDIAQITGTTVGALKASYHIAYEKIKKELI